MKNAIFTFAVLLSIGAGVAHEGRPTMHVQSVIEGSAAAAAKFVEEFIL